MAKLRLVGDIWNRDNGRANRLAKERSGFASPCSARGYMALLRNINL